MPKGESLHKKTVEKTATGYDSLKEIVSIAKKNGWDLEGLGLIPKDLPQKQPPVLTKKQATQRNKLVKSILQRFSKILTPPVPSELEDHIRNKNESDWLPWEQEAIDRIDDWRAKVNELRPAILGELRRALLINSEIGK